MPIPPFHHILVPTDFSPAASNASMHALALAKSWNARITFLHVKETLIPAIAQTLKIPIHEVLEDKETAKQQIKDWIGPIIKDYPEISYDLRTQEGNLIEVINYFCTAGITDLIVMGTKGADGVEEYIIGTNTARVTEEVACPVMVIPEKAKFKPYQKIMFCTDNQFGDVLVLEKLHLISQQYNAPIEAVHFTKEEGETEFLTWLKMLCERRMPYHNIIFKTIVQTQSTLKNINNYIEEEKIDLVALSSTNKGFVKKLFSGSLTEKMAYQTHIPFLAFDTKKDVNYEI